MLDQVGRGLRHAAGASGVAKSSVFTGERHQLLMGAFPTPQAQKLWKNLQASYDLAQGTKRRKTA